MHKEDGDICIDLMSQAYNDAFMERIISDNTAAAELFENNITETSSIPVFLNQKDSLSRTIISTYYKLNNSSSGGGSLLTDMDNYFTPCSYLAAKAPKADIVHLRYNSDEASRMINTLLCYIAYRGNNLIL